MKIIRKIGYNLVEIELTKKELESAFRERDRQYMMYDIKSAIERITENLIEKDPLAGSIDLDAIMNNESLCTDIIDIYKDIACSDNGRDWRLWENSVREAIENVCDITNDFIQSEPSKKQGAVRDDSKSLQDGSFQHLYGKAVLNGFIQESGSGASESSVHSFESNGEAEC